MHFFNPQIFHLVYLIQCCYCYKLLIFTSVHVNQNFGHSNLCLLFKACPMIKRISRRYFTEGLAQIHRTRSLSHWLNWNFLSLRNKLWTRPAFPVCFISHFVTHALCSCQTLCLAFAWMCSFLSALSCTCLSVCINLADCPRPSCHIYFVWSTVCGPVLITHQTLSKFMWSLTPSLKLRYSEK